MAEQQQAEPRPRRRRRAMAIGISTSSARDAAARRVELCAGAGMRLSGRRAASAQDAGTCPRMADDRGSGSGEPRRCSTRRAVCVRAAIQLRQYRIRLALLAGARSASPAPLSAAERRAEPTGSTIAILQHCSMQNTAAASVAGGSGKRLCCGMRLAASAANVRMRGAMGGCGRAFHTPSRRSAERPELSVPHLRVPRKPAERMGD
ncbi:hypothetical protein FA09DRAFT_63166 [Tilletiopsis washingtonensis]|jgi:hypothetical protein|uniref:Uncharacterized protein n=1 Tax=Tilletiopsis washingtonensis TaxID=58919 RepID=A0A316Z848_9BASI|nr:hypothetical protein FA09DRAFT_63166 [Tilletiopsis washingtonensis]PWN97168.1 hypothetical protein FA09DRAFT_63166 [Tilletiopsis washingtonensis]